MKATCPVHGIPDCSPLLNGCSIPTYLAAQTAVVLAPILALHHESYPGSGWCAEQERLEAWPCATARAAGVTR